uniref:Solute carrier family 22 member 4-like n=1 Tax=Saccoglossus kowalevskii TaxID=10224 RepID=A0ABM0N0K2_SACKO|nr:PREDICTED: solute carrier family 22 member 4-like [Saccoglossus kowalevskii]
MTIKPSHWLKRDDYKPTRLNKFLAIAADGMDFGICSGMAYTYVIGCIDRKYANSFMSASSDHYCKLYDNQTFHDTSPLKNCTIPYDAEDEAWDSCSRYDVNVSMGISPELCSQDSGTQDCDNGWVYDTSVYERTVVHEYDLVCEKDWMKQLSKSIVPLGNLVGGIIFGQLADIFGRKPLFIIAMMSSIVVGIVAAFSQTYAFFIVCQFLIGIFSISMTLIGYVIVMELTGTAYRVTCAVMTGLFISVGLLILAMVAPLSNGDWRVIQLVGGLLCLMFIPYYWLLPESVRWLIQKEKYDKAEKILHKAAKMNKVILPNDLFQEERKMAVEIPGTLSCWVLLDKVGRRWLMCSYMVLGGIALIISVPPDNINVSATCAMIGKFFMSGSWTIIYIFSAEIYPTTVRNAGMGVSSTWARVGSIISPYIMLLSDIWDPMPYLIMGITSIIAGLFALLLPETSHKDLPETLAEGELFGTKHANEEADTEIEKTTEMEIQCDIDITDLDKNILLNSFINANENVGVINDNFENIF